MRTVLWTGKISIKGSEQNMNANILVIAKKRPLRVRIEVSNWLAGPIMYLIVDGKKILLLSIKEKKAYISSIKNINRLSPIKIIPPEFDENDIWPILRGIPCFPPSRSAERKILLENGSISFLLKDTKIKYENYKKYQGVVFAKEIKILYYPTQTSWELSIRHIQFNKKIPSNIFNLAIPPEFQIVYQL